MLNLKCNQQNTDEKLSPEEVEIQALYMIRLVSETNKRLKALGVSFDEDSEEF